MLCNKYVMRFIPSLNMCICVMLSMYQHVQCTCTHLMYKQLCSVSVITAKKCTGSKEHVRLYRPFVLPSSRALLVKINKLKKYTRHVKKINLRVRRPNVASNGRSHFGLSVVASLRGFILLLFRCGNSNFDRFS